MSELAAMIEEDLRRAYEEADFEQLPTFIFEEAEETILDFSQGFVNALVLSKFC